MVEVGAAAFTVFFFVGVDLAWTFFLEALTFL